MSRPVTKQDGFTIIELMIATMIFALILVVVTTGVMRFTKQYYKGVISNSTQNTSRAIIDDVSRAIQFNSGDVYKLTTNDPLVPANSSNPAVGYCIGDSKQYSFVLNRQVKQDSPSAALNQSKYGLVSENVAGCTTNTVARNTATITSLTGVNSRELLGQHMRLNKFDISGTGGVYTITVKVIYGDNDLLCSPSVPGDCNTGSGTSAHLSNSDLTCRSMSGAQFCAVSELTTTVKKRVN